MTIKQQGGIFGRNPTFNNITAEGITSLDGPVVINESGADVDFRVESDTKTNALFVDGATGNVGVGINNAPYNLVISNGGAEGLEIGPGYAGNRTLFQNYNRATSQYVAAWEYASEYVWNIGGTEKMRLNTSGNLAMASGNGIDFSATAGTGTSELFDDYEEGTWTPSFNTLTIGNGTLIGRYTKIGRTVTCEFGFIFGSTSSFSGTVGSVGGFPFAAANLGADTYSAISGVAFEVGAGWHQLNANLFRSGSYAIGPSVGTTTPFTWAANDTLVMTAVYEAA
jgi:hypothetical protein